MSELLHDSETKLLTADDVISFQGMRELAHRDTTGYGVTLLWKETDDSLFVSVVGDGEAHLIPVQQEKGRDLGHTALEAFNHPFAYAGEQSIKTNQFDIDDEAA